ncbi:MAG TPA: right-handed parallel beta-helix repeat-containing protein, partial [Rhodopila sp.]|nr:right-handed parallel beta-helix repeat-containing protein [Rhodopila sp.]
LARTIEVGPGRTFAVPSEAAAAARDGDTITIAPGTYYDCAVWRARALTIAASAPGVVITDKACAGKAAFIVLGDGVLIRGITFTRIRVEDGNGAGIRAEGRDLTVQDSHFTNNQAGIISSAAAGFLRVEGCSFNEIGSHESPQPRAIAAGAINTLHIAHSIFQHPRGGGFIAPSAQATELQDNRLSDEAGSAASPLVRVQGGVVTVEGNTITVGAAPVERPGAILVYGDAQRVAVRGNTLVEPSSQVPFLRNWSGAPATEADNTVPDGTASVSESGSLYHRLRYRLAQAREAAGNAVRTTRHQAAELARGLHLIR